MVTPHREATIRPTGALVVGGGGTRARKERSHATERAGSVGAGTCGPPLRRVKAVGRSGAFTSGAMRGIDVASAIDVGPRTYDRDQDGQKGFGGPDDTSKGAATRFLNLSSPPFLPVRAKHGP